MIKAAVIAQLMTSVRGAMERAHADLAARYERLSGSRDVGSPTVPVPATDEAVAALLMRAALGICDDSIAALVGSVDRTLASYVDPAQRKEVRDQLFTRSFILLAPCGSARRAGELRAPVAMIARVEQRIAQGDRDGARHLMDAMNERRRVMRPGAASLDHVIVEAWVRDVTGDPSAAAARLDLALSALPTLSPGVVTEPVMAGSVGHAMVYRAQLADRLGDPSTAALWASRVLTLWAHADHNLDPAIAAMRALAAHHIPR